MTFSTYINENKGSIRALKNKGEIVKFWEIKFLSTVPFTELEACHIEDFLWHACRDNLVPHLEGDEANQAFDKIAKDEVIVFYQDKSDCYHVRQANKLTHVDFVSEMNVYVVDKYLKWTYIKTHEKKWGPYFIEIKN